jgi:hypothetical protein
MAAWGGFDRVGARVVAVAAAVAALTLDAGAAAPGGASQKAKFRVTLSGTISSAVNSYPDLAARCRPAIEVGVWRLLTFRSARPTLVTVVAGRGRAAPVRFVGSEVRRLLGEIQLAAPSQYELVCPDGTRTTVPGEHFTGSTSWRGGAVRLASPRKGRIVLGPLNGVPEDPGGACGQQSGAPLGLELAPGRIVEARLFNRGLKRLVVRGEMHRSARPSPTCGVSEAVDWKLVLRRIR